MSELEVITFIFASIKEAHLCLTFSFDSTFSSDKKYQNATYLCR